MANRYGKKFLDKRLMEELWRQGLNFLTHPPPHFLVVGRTPLPNAIFFYAVHKTGVLLHFPWWLWGMEFFPNNKKDKESFQIVTWNMVSVRRITRITIAGQAVIRGVTRKICLLVRQKSHIFNPLPIVTLGKFWSTHWHRAFSMDGY